MHCLLLSFSGRCCDVRGVHPHTIIKRLFVTVMNLMTNCFYAAMQWQFIKSSGVYLLATDVLKSLADINPDFMKSYFTIKEIPYCLQATSKTWTRTLKNLDPETPGLWKTWTLKYWTLKNLDLENLGHKKGGKQLDVEKWLEDYII